MGYEGLSPLLQGSILIVSTSPRRRRPVAQAIRRGSAPKEGKIETNVVIWNSIFFTILFETLYLPPSFQGLKFL